MEKPSSPKASETSVELLEVKGTPSPCSGRSPNTGNMSLIDWRDSPSRSDSGAEESLVNPPPPTELGEDECAVLRGDAIGNTAYTQRWVLNTLLVITQALPYYLAAEVEPVEVAAVSVRSGQGDLDSSKNMDTEDTAEEVEVANSSDEERPTVLELAEDVESAACQLWDMTVEPDVVQHLLNLGAVDILQLATDIITLSRAPRLTEVVVGVIANLSCQAEGCKRIINHEALMNALLSLPQTTDDVPTLIETFRFLRLLLWHLSHRIPISLRIGCPLVRTLMGHESLKVALVFILKNSLNEALLSSVIQFLEILLYLWLPDDQCYMAAYYAESALLEGVVEVMRHVLKQAEKSGSQEMPKEVHKGVLILYSFVGIHASHLISSFDQYESLLEPILACYVEHIAKVEKAEELLEDENAERLTYALGLCELLVLTMRHPSILSSIGKLLVLTQIANHPYAKQMPTTPKPTDDRKLHRRLRRSRSRRSRSSQEQMETDTPPPAEQAVKVEGHEGNSETLVTEKTIVEKDRTGSLSGSFKGSPNLRRSYSEPVGAGVADDLLDGSFISRVSEQVASKEKSEKNSISKKFNSVIESLIDYCVKVVKYSRDLFAVLTALNECHVDEVQLFFRAVRFREPKLVGDLQEKLLDTGSHNRLVTILSDMYT